MNRFLIAAAGAIVVGLAPPLASASDGYDVSRVAPVHDASGLGVGSWIADAAFTDLAGTPGRLSDFAGARALVIAMRDVSCPLAQKIGPATAEIEKSYTDKGVAFLYLNVSTTDTPEQISESQSAYGMHGRVVHDPERELAAALGPMTTTEAFVLDSSRTLRFRGAVTDRFGVGSVRPGEAASPLGAALDAVLGGREVATAATTAPGCLLEIERAPTRGEGEAPTWNREISRVFQASCVECHRGGGIGPFPLDTYGEAGSRLPMLKYMVGERLMPPWHAAPNTGPWVNDRSLSDKDVQAVLDWIAAGGPEGEPAEAPAPLVFDDTEWQIGEPDLVLELDAVDIASSGTVDYIYQYIETGLRRDRWVQAVEIRTETPSVMHHALAFVEAPRKEGESDRQFRGRWQGGADSYFAGLVPGQGPTVFPDGQGMKLPRRSWLKFQLHYTPDGTRRTDTVRIGFKFAESTPEEKVFIEGVYNEEFTIPAGAAAHVVVAEQRVNSRRTILGFSPHMHLRGASYKYELTTPEGETTTICDVPSYDFDWQHFYKLAEPLLVEKGSKLTCTAVFDNSEDNPQNPDPGKDVSFGEQTWDEMMIGYYMHYRSPKPLYPVTMAPAAAD